MNISRSKLLLFAVSIISFWHGSTVYSAAMAGAAASQKKGWLNTTQTLEVGPQTLATVNTGLTAFARAAVRASEITKQGKETAGKFIEALLAASKRLPESATHLGNALSAGAAHLPQTSQNIQKTAKIIAHTAIVSTATAGKYCLDTADVVALRAVQGADVAGHHMVQAVVALEPSVARVENMTLSLPLLAHKIIKSGTLFIGGAGISKMGITIIIDGYKKYNNSNSDPEKRGRLRVEGANLIKFGAGITATGLVGMYWGTPTIERGAPIIARPVIPPVVSPVAPA